MFRPNLAVVLISLWQFCLGLRIYKEDKRASVILHGQLWEDGEVKEYEMEAEVLDEEQPLEKPRVTWGTNKFGERHFTMTFKFRGPNRKEDPEKKHIDKLNLELYSTREEGSNRKANRVEKDIRHTFTLRNVNYNKHYALDLTKDRAREYESIAERHEALERRRKRRRRMKDDEEEDEGRDGEEEDDDEELDEEEAEEWAEDENEEGGSEGWRHKLDNHEQELHEHRLGQMGEGRKRLKEARNKTGKGHPEPRGIIQGVVWDEDGLIIEEPFIKLRQEGKELRDYEVLCNGNGFFEIEVYGNYKGRVEIVYGNDKEHTEGFVEDIDVLFKAALPDHPEHDQFHGLKRKPKTERHRRILHLHYKEYGPYMFAYHIYGVVLRLDNQHIPQVVMDTEQCTDCPYLQLEYTSEHEHNVHKRVKAEIDHNLDTGEFRITIRNGYGLDPEQKRRMDKDYGKLNIIVAMSRKDLNEGLYRVYTVDVLDCLRHYNKHREILFLYADKDSLSFERFDIKEPIGHKLQFQLRQRADDGTEGQCAMLAERPPEGELDAPWMVFKDKAGNHMRVDKHVKQSGFRQQDDIVYLVETNFAPSLTNEFFIHIDCKHNSKDRENEPDIVYHTSFHDLDGDVRHGKDEFVLLTAPLKVDKVVWAPLEVKKKKEEKGFRKQKVGIQPSKKRYSNRRGTNTKRRQWSAEKQKTIKVVEARRRERTEKKKKKTRRRMESD